MRTRDLELYTRVEVLLNTMYPRLVNFPKAEKFALSEYIKIGFFDILGALASADRVPSKRMIYAQEADGYLQKLRSMINLAVARKYISTGFYKDVDLELTKISKMMTSYIKSSRR